MIFDLNRLSSDEKTTKGYCKGTVIYKENVYHDADILYIFNTSQNISDIESILSLIRGYFSIILPLNDSIVLISDQLNSVPLYYNCDLITDHFNSRYNKDIDNDNLILYQLSGVMPRDACFNSKLKATQPGEIIVIYSDCGEIIKHDYSSFFEQFSIDNKTRSKIDFSNWAEEYKHVIDLTISDLLQIGLNKKILLPLSGGFDSRLIADILSKAGFKDVLCFTYGITNSPEVAISKAVASHYGFEWVFIEYNSEEWKDLFDSEQYISFITRYSAENAVKHLQDFIAINHLISDYKIDRSKTIVVPGHALDFLAGNHIPIFCFENDIIKKSDLVDYIENRHFSLRYKSCYERNLVLNYIESRLKELGCLTFDSTYIPSKEAINLYMRFNFYERQSKFILSSLRIYDFFNLRWHLPLWSNYFIQYFENCDPSLLKNRYVSIEWDSSFIKPQFNPDLQGLIYPISYVKPIKSNLFLKSRAFLRKILIYNIITSIYLIRKIFFKDDFAWFSCFSFLTKFFGALKGYKEIYSFYANK